MTLGQFILASELIRPDFLRCSAMSYDGEYDSRSAQGAAPE